MLLHREVLTALRRLRAGKVVHYGQGWGMKSTRVHYGQGWGMKSTRVQYGQGWGMKSTRVHYGQC